MYRVARAAWPARVALRAMAKEDVRHIADVLLIRQRVDCVRRKDDDRFEMCRKFREQFDARVRIKFIAPNQCLQKEPRLFR